MEKDERVRVVCRVRPLNEQEQRRENAQAVTVLDNKSLRVRGEFEVELYTFTFDAVLPPDCSQEDVYDCTAQDVVSDIFKGYNGTVFAYGQTSSGKTHTMEGPSADAQHSSDLDNLNLRGVIPRAVNSVFKTIEATDDSIEFILRVSMMEIYMERIRDLLDPTRENLQVQEDPTRGVWVRGLTEKSVASYEEVMDLLRGGSKNRAMSATGMNERSSRSHSIFVLSVTQRNSVDLSEKIGRLFLVDLAGSEKVSKTLAAGQTLEEAKNINKSLAALGNVIYALTEKKSGHIPYRDSKLTRVLQESLGGNSRTTLIVCASPAVENASESLSTFRFGNRAKSIRNHAKVNDQKSIKELLYLLEVARAENERLRLEMSRAKEPPSQPPATAMATELQKSEELEKSEGSDKSERDHELQSLVTDEERNGWLQEEITLREEIESLKAKLSLTQEKLNKSQLENEDLREKLERQNVAPTTVPEVSRERVPLPRNGTASGPLLLCKSAVSEFKTRVNSVLWNSQQVLSSLDLASMDGDGQTSPDMLLLENLSDKSLEETPAEVLNVLKMHTTMLGSYQEFITKSKQMTQELCKIVRESVNLMSSIMHAVEEPSSSAEEPGELSPNDIQNLHSKILLLSERCQTLFEKEKCRRGELQRAAEVLRTKGKRIEVLERLLDTTRKMLAKYRERAYQLGFGEHIYKRGTLERIVVSIRGGRKASTVETEVKE